MSQKFLVKNYLTQNDQQTKISVASYFNNNGFLNATETVKNYNLAMNKNYDLSNFLRSKSFQGYVNTLINLINSKSLDISGINAPISYSELVYIKRGHPDLGGGTWLHPKLAILFARWLSDEFAIWCDQQIDEILFCQKLQNILDNNELSNYINNNLQRSIYVFYSDNLNAYKIGVSRNVEDRLDQIKNQLRSLGFNAIGTRIIFSQICEENQAFKLEKQIHQYYEMFRMNQSEWFNFDESQIKNVINYIKSQLNFVAEKNNSGV